MLPNPATAQVVVEEAIPDNDHWPGSGQPRAARGRTRRLPKAKPADWIVPERALREQPGSILQPGEGLNLEPKDEEDLRGRLQVIRHAQDALRRLAPRS